MIDCLYINGNTYSVRAKLDRLHVYNGNTCIEYPHPSLLPRPRRVLVVSLKILLLLLLTFDSVYNTYPCVGSLVGERLPLTGGALAVLTRGVPQAPTSLRVAAGSVGGQGRSYWPRAH